MLNQGHEFVPNGREGNGEVEKLRMTVTSASRKGAIMAAHTSAMNPKNSAYSTLS